MLTGLLFSQDTTEVKFIISDLTKVKNFNGVISSENVLKISEEYGLDNDQIMELFRPYSKIYSKVRRRAIILMWKEKYCLIFLIKE